MLGLPARSDSHHTHGIQIGHDKVLLTCEGLSDKTRILLVFPSTSFCFQTSEHEDPVLRFASAASSFALASVMINLYAFD